MSSIVCRLQNELNERRKAAAAPGRIQSKNHSPFEVAVEIAQAEVESRSPDPIRVRHAADAPPTFRYPPEKAGHPTTALGIQKPGQAQPNQDFCEEPFMRSQMNRVCQRDLTDRSVV